MIVWAYINAILSLMVVCIIVYELINYGDMLITAERIGKGLIGAGMWLSIALIFDVDHYGTPFDGWAASLVRIGIAVYIIGRITRHVRHARNNQRQREIASDYLRERGLLPPHQ